MRIKQTTQALRVVVIVVFVGVVIIIIIIIIIVVTTVVASVTGQVCGAGSYSAIILMNHTERASEKWSC